MDEQDSEPYCEIENEIVKLDHDNVKQFWTFLSLQNADLADGMTYNPLSLLGWFVWTAPSKQLKINVQEWIVSNTLFPFRTWRLTILPWSRTLERLGAQAPSASAFDSGPLDPDHCDLATRRWHCDQYHSRTSSHSSCCCDPSLTPAAAYLPSTLRYLPHPRTATSTIPLFIDEFLINFTFCGHFLTILVQK